MSRTQSFLSWYFESVYDFFTKKKTTSPETFGEVSVPTETVKKLLKATEARRNSIKIIHNHLLGLPLEDRPLLIDRVIERFALYVHSLPASESHHHSGSYGLLDHSLDVAARVMAALSGRKIHASEDNPVINEAQKPSWTYAAFVAALFHDVGRVRDMKVFAVSAPLDEENTDHKPWNANKEPLANFTRRHGLEDVLPENIKWQEGRGQHRHELRMLVFDRLILPPAALTRLGWRFSQITEAYLERNKDLEIPGLPRAATEIADQIRKHDKASTWAAEPGTSAGGTKPQTSTGTTKSTATGGESPPPPSPPTENKKATSKPKEYVVRGRRKPSTSGSPAPEPKASPQTVTGPSVPPVEIGKEIPAPEVVESERDVQPLPTPEDLLRSLAISIGDCTANANTKFGNAWIQAKYVWIDVDKHAQLYLKELALQFEMDLIHRILDAMEAAGALVPFTNGNRYAMVKIHSRSQARRVIRVRTESLFSKERIASMEPWPHDVVLHVETRISAQPCEVGSAS